MLLTDEEIIAIDKQIGNDQQWLDENDEYKAIIYEQRIYAKAQLKKMAEWGDETCPHKYDPPFNGHKRECSYCWQSLLDEVE